MGTAEARAEAAAEEQSLEEKIEELRRELAEVERAEQEKLEEQERLETERSVAVDSDDNELIQTLLSGKSLPKHSSLRAAMSRLDELPHELYILRRRILQLKIRIAEIEQVGLEEERRRCNRAYQEAEDKFQQAREEKDFAESYASAAAEDVRTRKLSRHNLEQQLAAHEQGKPSNDLFEERLARHRVWRW